MECRASLSGAGCEEDAAAAANNHLIWWCLNVRWSKRLDLGLGFPPKRYLNDWVWCVRGKITDKIALRLLIKGNGNGDDAVVILRRIGFQALVFFLKYLSRVLFNAKVICCILRIFVKSEKIYKGEKGQFCQFYLHARLAFTILLRSSNWDNSWEKNVINVLLQF